MGCPDRRSAAVCSISRGFLRAGVAGVRGGKLTSVRRLLAPEEEPVDSLLHAARIYHHSHVSAC
jgi:hypothetical protein